jgi:hypothetical protein
MENEDQKSIGNSNDEVRIDIDDDVLDPEALKARQLEHRRTYNREYYHKHKTRSTCEHCGNEYTSVSSLRKHERRSTKCQVGVMKKVFAQIIPHIDDKPELIAKLTNVPRITQDKSDLKTR